MAYILQELMHAAVAAARTVPTGQIKLRLQVATEKKTFDHHRKTLTVGRRKIKIRKRKPVFGRKRKIRRYIVVV